MMTIETKRAPTKYDFYDMETRDLYRFARNLPADLEANERTQLIRELADRMMFWFNGASL